jgi:hypothetical protein
MQSKAAVFLHWRPLYCALTTIVMIHVSKINERGLERELFGQTTHEPGQSVLFCHGVWFGIPGFGFVSKDLDLGFGLVS